MSDTFFQSDLALTQDPTEHLLGFEFMTKALTTEPPLYSDV